MGSEEVTMGSKGARGVRGNDREQGGMMGSEGE